jgi:hypothetical protein
MLVCKISRLPRLSLMWLGSLNETETASKSDSCQSSVLRRKEFPTTQHFRRHAKPSVADGIFGNCMSSTKQLQYDQEPGYGRDLGLVRLDQIIYVRARQPIGPSKKDSRKKIAPKASPTMWLGGAILRSTSHLGCHSSTNKSFNPREASFCRRKVKED